MAYVTTGTITRKSYRPPIAEDKNLFQDLSYEVGFTANPEHMKDIQGIYIVPNYYRDVDTDEPIIGDFDSAQLHLVYKHQDYTSKLNDDVKLTISSAPFRAPVLKYEAWKQGVKEAMGPNPTLYNMNWGGIPIYAKNEDAIKYIKSGDTSDALNHDEIAYGEVYLDFYVDGDKYPNLSASFNVEHDSESCDLLFSFYFTLGDNVGGVSFKDCSVGKIVTTSFKSVVEATDLSLLNSILYEASKPFTGGDVKLYGICEKRNGQGSVSYKGEATTDYENNVFIRWHNTNDGDESKDSTEDSYENPDSESDTDNEENDTSLSTVGVLTKTYVLTKDQLNNIGQKLWDSTFLQNLQLVNNNPIENVTSCMLYPFSISGGTQSTVYIGNVSMGITGNLITESLPVWKSEHIKVGLNGKIPTWANFEPYTRLSIYLPYIGIKEIPTNEFMGNYIEVRYAVDVMTGTCKAILYNKKGKVCDFNGQIGISIPLTASNKAQQSLAYLQNVADIGGAVASKNVGGIVDGVSNLISNPFKSQTKGSNSSTLETYMGKEIILYRDRPVIQYPSTFAHQRGLPCKLSKVIGKQTGYIQCSKDIQLKNINATETEKSEIESLLTSGVYV